MSDITDATAFSNKKNLYFQALKALIRYQSHCFPDHLETTVARLLEVRNTNNLETDDFPPKKRKQIFYITTIVTENNFSSIYK